jgi:hypothetical protein
MTSEYKIKTFSEFMDSVHSGRQEYCVGKKGNKVANEAEFRSMKEYLTNYYQGFEVLHSFADGGSVFDCIPAEQQPSLRALGQKLAKVPDGPKKGKTGARENIGGIRAEPPLHPNRKDRFGNTMFCPPGTIPLRRITLDELARFETLRQYFQKSSGRSGPFLSDSGHRHAWQGQIVDNLGGHSVLSVWNPSIDYSVGQKFSLGPQWYSSGSPDNNTLQTAEVGWHVMRRCAAMILRSRGCSSLVRRYGFNNHDS